MGLPWWFKCKESACNVGDQSLIPGLGRSSGEENGYPLQYSCLENSKDRGAWQAMVHGVAKSQTRQLLTEGSGNAQNHVGNHFGTIGLKLKICIIISFCLKEILNHVHKK